MPLNPAKILAQIRERKELFIIGIITYSSGIVLSLFFTIPEEGVFSDCGKIFDVLICGSFPLKYYLLRIVCECLLVAVSFLCGMSVFSLPIAYLLTATRAFLTGLTIKVIICSYSVMGLTIGILVVFPASVIAFFGNLCAAVFSFSRFYSGRCPAKKDVEDIPCIFLFTFLIAVASVLYVILISLLIIRPIHYGL